VAKYVAQSQPSSIDLVVFNSSGARVKRVTPAELDGELRAVLYRGATSFAVLDNLQAPAADRCLVFSDGVATIDARPRFDAGCEVFAITSAADADRGLLQRLTGGVASAVLSLRSQAEAEVLARLQGQAPRVVQVRGEDGRALRFVTLDGGPAGWSVITEVPVSGNIIVRIAGLGSDLVDRSYAPGWCAARASTAPARCGPPTASPRSRPKTALTRSSSRCRAASPWPAPPCRSWCSKIGRLRRGRDRAAVQLPEGVDGGVSRGEGEHERERRELQDQRIDEVARRWSEVVDWWKTDFDARAKKEADRLRSVVAAPAPPPPARGTASWREESENSRSAVVALQAESLEAVTVTGLRGSSRSSMQTSRASVTTADIEIAMKEWDVARPYIAALNAARPWRDRPRAGRPGAPVR
jgi:hypothetical protein